MKRLITSFCFIVFSLMSYGQGDNLVDFDFIVAPPYPSTVGDLLTSTELSVTIYNNVPRDIDAAFYAEIYVQDHFGNTIGSIIPASLNEFLLKQSGLILEENNSIGVTSDFDFNSLGFTNTSVNDFVMTGVIAEQYNAFTSGNVGGLLESVYLPEGNYIICLTAYDRILAEQISPRHCSEEFSIESAKVEITAPFQGDTIYCDELEGYLLDWELDLGFSVADESCFEYDMQVLLLNHENPSLTYAHEKLTEANFVGDFNSITELSIQESEYFIQGDFGADLELIDGKTYAMWVRAKNVNSGDDFCSGVSMDASGYSDVHIFHVRCDDFEDEVLESQENVPCEECDEFSVDENSVLFTGNQLQQFTAGYFAVDVLESSHSGDKYSGEGVIQVDLFGFTMPIGVEFSNVQINKKKQLVSGELKSRKSESGLPAVEMQEGTEFTLADLKERSPEQYDQFVANTMAVFTLLESIEDVVGGDGLPLPFGLDMMFSGKQVRIALDEMVFGPEGAKLQAVFNVPLPFNENSVISYLSLAFSDLCFTPSGGTVDMNVRLDRDLPVVPSEELSGYEFTVNGCANCSQEEAEVHGSYIDFGCDGIEGVRLDCSIYLPSSTGGDGEALLIPFAGAYSNEQDIPDRVKASFSVELQRGDEELDWLFSANVSPFEFSGVDDWGFEVQQAWVDLSELKNPAQMIFPNGHRLYGPSYDEEKQEWKENNHPLAKQWQGVFIAAVNIYLPNGIKGNFSDDFKLGVANTVIDFEGFNVSTSVAATDVFNRDSVSLGNFDFGLEELSIRVANNEFQGGRLKGTLGAPFVHEEDYFDYEALITDTEEKLDYIFSVKIPKDKQLRIPMWITQAKLSKESHLTIQNTDDDNFQFSANLSGMIGISESGASSMDLQNKLKDVPLDLIGIPFILSYDEDGGFHGYVGLTPDLGSIIRDFKRQYEEDKAALDVIFGNSKEENPSGSSQSPDTEPNSGSGTSASTEEEEGKKSLAGFDLSFHDVSIGGTITNPRLYLEPRILLMSGGGESDEETLGFGADTRIYVLGEYTGSRYRFKSIEMECLGIDAQISEVYMRGSICYKDNAERKEFSGELIVETPIAGVAMVGAFGTDKTQDNLRYWYVDVMGKYTAGIPIPGVPVSLYGLGGGVFWNCDYKPQFAATSFGRGKFASFPNSDGQSVPNFEDRSLYPADRIDIRAGFMRFGLEAVFGATGVPESYNFDLGVYAAIDRSTSAFQLDLRGEGYLMSDIWAPKAVPAVKASLFIRLEIQNLAEGEVAFYTVRPNDPNAESLNKVDIKIPSSSSSLVRFTGYIPFDFAIRPSEGDYHLWVGTPYQNHAIGYTGPVEFTVSTLNLDRSVRSYLMLGTGLPDTVYLPEEVQNYFGQNTVGTGDGRGTIHSDIVQSVDGKSRSSTDAYGIAFGSGFFVEEFKWLVLETGLQGSAAIGFDINITRSLSRRCGGLNPGIDGWYALGQFYAGANLELKVLGGTLAEMTAVIVAQGGTPKPTWARVKGRFHYRIWGGPIFNALANTADCLNRLRCGFGLFCDGGDCDFTEDHTEGDFHFDEVFGNDGVPCLPSGPLSEEVPDIIKSFSITDGSQDVDFLTDKIHVSFYLNPCDFHPISVVQNQELETRYLKSTLHSAVLYDDTNQRIVKSWDWSSENFCTLSLQEADLLSLRNFELLPSTQYSLSLELSTRLSGQNFDGSKEINFQTAALPNDLLDGDHVEKVFPKNYSLYHHVDDEPKGGIKLNDYLFDLMFPEPISSSGTSSSGTSSSGTSGSGTATGPAIWTGPASWLSAANSAPELVQGANNMGVNVSPVAGIIETILSDVQTKFRVVVREVKSGNLVKTINIRSSTLDRSESLLLFDLGDLKTKTGYEVFLQRYVGGEGSNPYRSMYSYTFRTSRFRTFEEKIAASSIEQKSGVNYIRLAEPFDTYDKSALSFSVAADSDELQEFRNTLQPLYLKMDQFINTPMESSAIAEHSSSTGEIPVRILIQRHWIRFQYLDSDGNNQTITKKSPFASYTAIIRSLYENRFAAISDGVFLNSQITPKSNNHVVFNAVLYADGLGAETIAENYPNIQYGGWDPGTDLTSGLNFSVGLTTGSSQNSSTASNVGGIYEIPISADLLDIDLRETIVGRLQLLYFNYLGAWNFNAGSEGFNTDVYIQDGDRSYLISSPYTQVLTEHYSSDWFQTMYATLIAAGSKLPDLDGLGQSIQISRGSYFENGNKKVGYINF